MFEEQKLKFDIAYYPVFLNTCNILEEVYALLVAEKEQKIQFFCNDKSLNDLFIGAALSII